MSKMSPPVASNVAGKSLQLDDFPQKKHPFPVDVPDILVGGIPTPLKNMSSSVGMRTFPIYGKIKFMFQTTNQYSI
jgi:hypothetical protein